MPSPARPRLATLLLPPLAYLAAGGAVTALLLRQMTATPAEPWLVLLVPMLLCTTLLTVAGLAGAWVRYRTWDEGLLYAYTTRRLAWLSLRVWLVVVTGLAVGLLIGWMRGLLPPDVVPLARPALTAGYVALGLLTLAGVLSIVRGEDLAEIKLRNAQNENHLLKTQLNPHFLYNTLNNIDALVWTAPEQASASLTEMAALMRYLTYSAREQRVALADEVAMLEQMAHLWRLRLPPDEADEALVTDVADEARGSSLPIAPLLLMPLAENAFKHCATPRAPHAVVLSLTIDAEGLLTFTTDNAAAPAEALRAAARQPHGVGLDVLRRRLRLLYPSRFSLSGQRQGERYVARLTLRLDRPQPHHP